MSTRLLPIATNTFREAIRDRVLYNLVAFALLMAGTAILVGQISIDMERLVVINLGLAAVSLFGVVIAIFIGIGLVSGGEQPVYGCGRLCGTGLRIGSPPVAKARRLRACRPVLHRASVCDGDGAGTLVLLVFLSPAFGGLCVRPVSHREFF
jgi:hypothetical protein